MEILEFVIKYINSSKKTIICSHVLLVIMVIGSQLWDIWENDVCNLALLLCQVMVLVTVLIWIYIAPSSYALIQELKNLFSDTSYQMLVQRNQEWIKLWITRRNKQRITRRNKQRIMRWNKQRIKLRIIPRKKGWFIFWKIGDPIKFSVNDKE